MSMNELTNGLSAIVGKRIRAVVAGSLDNGSLESYALKHSPSMHVVLIFDDDTTFDLGGFVEVGRYVVPGDEAAAVSKMAPVFSGVAISREDGCSEVRPEVSSQSDAEYLEFVELFVRLHDHARRLHEYDFGRWYRMWTWMTDPVVDPDDSEDIRVRAVIPCWTAATATRGYDKEEWKRFNWIMTSRADRVRRGRWQQVFATLRAKYPDLPDPFEGD